VDGRTVEGKVVKEVKVRKERNTLRIKMFFFVFFHGSFINPALVPWGLCDPSPL